MLKTIIFSALCWGPSYFGTLPYPNHAEVPNLPEGVLIINLHIIPVAIFFSIPYALNPIHPKPGTVVSIFHYQQGSINTSLRFE